MDKVAYRQILLDAAHQQFIRDLAWPDAEKFAIDHHEHILVLDEMQSNGLFRTEAGKIVPPVPVLQNSNYWADEKKGIDIIYPILQALFRADSKSPRSMAEIMQQRTDVMWPPEGAKGIKRLCLYLYSVGVLAFSPGPDYNDAKVVMNLNILRYKDFSAVLESHGGPKTLAIVVPAAPLPSFEIIDNENERDAGIPSLWNKKKMLLDIPMLFKKAEIEKYPLGMIMIDLNHFKQINETYKHQKADEVLTAFGESIATVLKGKGRAYRFGGDEVLIALMNFDVQESVALAERMRKAIEFSPMAGIKVTASFGVGVFPDHGNTSEVVIKAADDALYDAKNRGRNLVRYFKEPEPKENEPRKVERKLPTPGWLTESHRKELRMQYFRGQIVKCPDDDALLVVNEINAIGSGPTTIMVRCKLCNNHEIF